MQALRLMIYDKSCRGRRGLPGLSAVWRAGGGLYSVLGRLDARRGFGTWHEALEWLVTESEARQQPIAEVQFWGHGRWGCALIDGQPLASEALVQGHALHDRLWALREHLSPQALWWWRTCETLGARRGQEFARRLSDFFGARVAGHTYRIAFYQSGLQALRPGMVPSWSPEEGLAAGSADAPELSQWSSARAPHTITCLQGRLPAYLA